MISGAVNMTASVYVNNDLFVIGRRFSFYKIKSLVKYRCV
ncbi:hypothetical protein Q428_05165 [Fervidicella metallireducens AeB]|uniref:Uncharacterized protein n=1 Tax=Fervidicella metallireducens AeB TaxID=1403537 RepID=A0A017RW89_9CLOT|nr:hypothetical protein Q428_05165 [Fervidicella metallireducens AeB]